MPTMNCSQEESDRLHSLVSGLHEKDADKKIAHVNDYIAKLSDPDQDTDDMSLLTDAGIDTTNLSREEKKDKVKSLRAEWVADYRTLITTNESLAKKNTDLEAKVQELSANDSPTLDLARTDPKVAKEYTNIYSEKLDLLVAKGNMTGVQNRLLKERLASDGVVMLSRENDEADRVMDIILSVFGEKLTPVGVPQTGVQHLSRETPSDVPERANTQEDTSLLKMAYGEEHAKAVATAR